MPAKVGQVNITNIDLNTTLHHIPPLYLTAQWWVLDVYCRHPLTSQLKLVIIPHNLPLRWLYRLHSHLHWPHNQLWTRLTPLTRKVHNPVNSWWIRSEQRWWTLALWRYEWREKEPLIDTVQYKLNSWIISVQQRYKRCFVSLGLPPAHCGNLKHLFHWLNHNPVMQERLQVLNTNRFHILTINFRAEGFAKTI